MGDAAVVPPVVDWGPWRTLECAPLCGFAGLRETLDGGQLFRWHADGPQSWFGSWGRHIACVRLQDDGHIAVAFPAGAESAALPALMRLLRLDAGLHARAVDALPWRSDPVLRAAMARFPGLRVVCQPLGEALLGFLCSTTKRIPQIKEAMGLLAARFGTPIVPGWNALPTWEQLATVPEADLRACKLGYRARYVRASACLIAAEPGFLAQVEALPYLDAHAALLRLPGVGAKVADCVLLYGSATLQPFPVDTWILQAMERLYGLEGWTPAQQAAFGRTHFGEHAGLAQQFLFAYMRANPRDRR